MMKQATGQETGQEQPGVKQLDRHIQSWPMVKGLGRSEELKMPFCQSYLHLLDFNLSGIIVQKLIKCMYIQYKTYIQVSFPHIFFKSKVFLFL